MIEGSIAKTNDGKIKVNQVAQAIRTITEQAGRIKTLVDEVSRGSGEQTQGIGQIAKVVIQMEQVTQKNAASAQQSAAAAEELSVQSETLREAMNQLQTLVGG